MEAITKLIEAAEAVDAAWNTVWRQPHDGCFVIPNDFHVAVSQLINAKIEAKAAMEANPNACSCEGVMDQVQWQAWVLQQLDQRDLSQTVTITVDGTIAKAAVEAKPTCGLCGKPMPPGEEMFQYHGASGPCPTDEAKTAPPTDAQIVAALRECDNLLKAVPGDVMWLTVSAGSSYAAGECWLDGSRRIGRYMPFAEAVAKLRELATPKPRTVAETWEAFKAGTLTAKERDLFCVWVGRQGPLVREVFLWHNDVEPDQPLHARLTGTLDIWFADHGNVPWEEER